MSAALRVEGLVVRYGKAGPPAVDGVDLELRRGEVLGLIGESGSGKTTLVRCALGLLPPAEGAVQVEGRPLSAWPRAELRRITQLLFQDPAAMLNPGLTVAEHLTESARLHRPHAPAADTVARVARQVGLAHRLQSLPRHLSGGEKRRAGLARVLVADPRILVADEPTAGLDAALKADLVELMLAGRGPDRAWLIVSHDLPLVHWCCDRVVVMYAGRIVEECPAKELGRRAHHPYTASLLAAAGMGPPVELRPEAPAGRGAPCPFYGPCPHGVQRCREARPQGRLACHVIEETP